MTDAYRGDSPAKKLARLNFWGHYYGRIDYWHPAIVLAGTGGDIATLIALGVPQSHIVAIDINAQRIRVCKEKFPDVSYFVGDVADVMKENNIESGVVLLDYCGIMSAKCLQTTIEVSQLIPNDSVLGIATLKCRDRSSIMWLPGRRSQLATNMVLQIIGGTSGTSRQLRRVLRKKALHCQQCLEKVDSVVIDYKHDRIGVDVGNAVKTDTIRRGRTLCDIISVLYTMFDNPKGFLYHSIFEYQSSTLDSCGSPMVIYGYIVGPLGEVQDYEDSSEYKLSYTKIPNDPAMLSGIIRNLVLEDKNMVGALNVDPDLAESWHALV